MHLFNWRSRAPLLRTFARPRRRLSTEETGVVGVVFGLSLLMVMTAVTIAVDYGRYLVIQLRLQQALDAALLAGSAKEVRNHRPESAAQFFASAFAEEGVTTSSSFNYSAPLERLSGTASAQMSSVLFGLLDRPLEVSVQGTVYVPRELVRALDVVMCIDSTSSMEAVLASVQSNARSFKSNLETALQELGVPLFDQYRTRVIYFKDFGGFGWYNITQIVNGAITYPNGGPISGAALGDPEPLRASSFFTLPAQVNDFTNFVDGVPAEGGGDSPESGLECLNEAMDSAWMTKGSILSDGRTVTDVYPVIAVYTDAGAHPPGFEWSLRNPNYPPASKMPRDFDGLLAKWNNPAVIDQEHKTILFFGETMVEDDQRFYYLNAWKRLRFWPGFMNIGNLTRATTSFVPSIAAGIPLQPPKPALIQ